MRALIIDDRAEAAAERVRAYASRPENLYIVRDGKSSQRPPGENWQHMCRLDSYRCVFSFTKDANTGKVYRHLSISIPSEAKYPHQAAAFTIAELFGFTGWDGRGIDSIPADWIGQVSEDEQCIILAQEIKPSTQGRA